MKENSIFIFIILLVVLGIAAVYFLFSGKALNQLQKVEEGKNLIISSNKCLSDNEVATYKNNKLDFVGKIGVIVKNKKNNEVISDFQIDDVMLRNYYPVELHKCGVYVLKSFNDDYKLSKTLPGFSKELWFYNYSSEGRMIIKLAGEDQTGKPEVYYSYDFRISPDERHLVLEKSYLGKEDYSLVIKDLNTKQDVFTLFSKDLQLKNSKFIGVFDMLEWSKDGRYFWGSVSDGAYVNGYFRIDAADWKVDIYEAPEGAMGGSKLNINTGYLPIQPGQIWTGDIEFDEINRESLLKEGKKSELYIYNLFTKEKIFITSFADDPLWWFKPKWLSDTELQYELPSGEKRIYNIDSY